MNPDQAFQNFDKFIKHFRKNTIDFNEADTRSKMIDYVLKDCLGWDEKNIRREDHVNSGFIDYVLVKDNAPIIIIEAKKTGNYFEIPESKAKRTYKISGAISSDDNLMMAFKQVHSYCIDIGCKFALISNGLQYVAFTAMTIGKPWREGFCTVYKSLEDIHQNFNTFWNTFAFENVKNGSLLSYLEKVKSTISFQKVVSEIYNPDQAWARNELYIYLQPYCDFVFSELLDEKRTDVLKECYVHDRSSTPLTKEIECFFEDKLPFFVKNYGVEDIVEDKLKSNKFQHQYLNKADEKGKGDLMVLLGGIGSGKSTFLHRFFRVVIAGKENHLWFYVDFRDAPLEEVEIENFIVEKILETWDSNYYPKYSKALKDISFRAERDNKKEYVQKIFALSTYLRFSTTVVIDNVDQHDFHFQEKIFLATSHFKDYLKTLTIISLREETFVASTRTGVFDAYYIQKFHLSSPNFLSMILKRIEFTIRLIDNKKDDPRFPAEDLKKYLEILKESLMKKNWQSKKIVEFIDSISVGNMREALRMFNNFIVSGNTNIREIFSKYDENKKADENDGYQIAYHQFIKSIMLGEYRYFSQERSQIMNLFDFDQSITDSCFNNLRILDFLLYIENKQSPIGRGYIEISELITTSEKVSIKKEAILDSLLRLSTFNLVEYDNLSRTNLKDASFVRITSSGKYYLKNLLTEFVYIDSITVDTPISDSSIISTLISMLNRLDLKSRFERTEIFIDYLLKKEEEEHKIHPEYLHSELTKSAFSAAIKDEFDNLKKNVSI